MRISESIEMMNTWRMRMDELTTYHFHQFLGREIVRTLGQDLTKKEMKDIIENCQELAYKFSKMKPEENANV